MRVNILGFIGAVGIALVWHTANATPSLPSSAALSSGSIAMQVAHHCGHGRRWVPAGYAKGGKYRAGHCAPVSASSASG